MNFRIPFCPAARLFHSGVPARIGSLVMLLQRSPLMKLLPEARVISTSGFSDAVTWTALTVAGLGAFNSVSRATSIQQSLPTLGSSTVTVTGGSNLNFVFQVVNAPMSTISSFVITGRLPPGLVHNDFKEPAARTNNISGSPLETGSFPITITAWEFNDNSGRSVSGNFTINVTAPPQPAITAQPQGGNFTPGSFVSLTASQTAGYRFVWKKDGQPLPDDSFVLASSGTPRRFLVPTTNPGNTWRSGAAFNDSAWTAVSGGIGYDINPSPVDYNPHIAAPAGNVEALMRGTGRPTSALIRIPFTMTESATISSLKLRVQSDDGFVAWLNGTEIAYQNRFATVNFDSAAAATAVDATAGDFREINISRFSTVLRSGENLLAVQAMNESNTSSDFLFNCELLGGIDATSTRRLILPSLQPADAGSYTVTISNSTGTVTSDPAVLVLPPSIEAHPGSIAVNSVETTTLTVTAATSPPWTYQWYTGASGNTTSPIDGATASSFTTPVLTATADYWVRVTNAAGIADSNSATVTVRDTFITWQNARFTSEELSAPEISGPAADPDGDSVSNDREYIFGTPPKTSAPDPMPSISFDGQFIALTFVARSATGAGYSGLVRHYAIETTEDVSAGPWTPVPLFSDVIATGQTITFLMTPGLDRTFCRLRVWLTP